MRAAGTEHLWRLSEAWRGNPTSCLRQDVMHVIGVRVQWEMTASQSERANSRALLDNTTVSVCIRLSNFTFDYFYLMSDLSSLSASHRQAHKYYRVQITD